MTLFTTNSPTDSSLEKSLITQPLLSASISLKIKEDIEIATEYLNTSIINAIRSSNLLRHLSANTNIPITY